MPSWMSFETRAAIKLPAVKSEIVWELLVAIRRIVSHCGWEGIPTRLDAIVGRLMLLDEPSKSSDVN